MNEFYFPETLLKLPDYFHESLRDGCRVQSAPNQSGRVDKTAPGSPVLCVLVIRVLRFIPKTSKQLLGTAWYYALCQLDALNIL